MRINSVDVSALIDFILFILLAALIVLQLVCISWYGRQYQETTNTKNRIKPILLNCAHQGWKAAYVINDYSVIVDRSGSVTWYKTLPHDCVAREFIF